MNVTELELRYIDRVKRVRSLLLLPAIDAKRLVEDLATTDGAQLLGVEGFRVFDDGGVQPGLEFSNISFGHLEHVGNKIELRTFDRGLRAPWRTEQDFCEKTQKLIDDGISNGFNWYEVSVEDLATNELLFFRRYGDEPE